MIVTETVGVGNHDDFRKLENMVAKEHMAYSSYFEDYDPTPYNVIIQGHAGRIAKVLRQLDSAGIYYETTAPYPE